MISRLKAILILISANILIYHDYWLLKKIFTGSDFFQLFVPLLNYQSDCLRGFSLPLWNPFVSFGCSWIEHYLSSVFFPTHLIFSSLMRYNLYIAQIEILIWIIIGGIGIYLCILEQGNSKSAGLIGGISFMFCGYMISLPTWSILIFNVSSFSFILFGYLRAKKTFKALSLVSVSFLTMSALGGYLPSTVLMAYFFIAYVIIDSLIEKKIIFGLKFLASTFSLFLLLASFKLLPVFMSLDYYPRLSEAFVPNVSYGIISFYEFMSFLLSVKHYFSLYIGILLIISLIYAVLKKKVFKWDALLIMVFLSIWVLIIDKNGNISLLHKLLNRFLPFMKPIRLEFLYWGYPLIFLIIYSARFLDNFMAQRDVIRKCITTVLVLIILSAVFILNYNLNLHYMPFIMQVVLVIAWIAVSLITKKRKLQASLAVMLIVIEFWVVFERVNIDELPVIKDNHIELRLTHQNNVSRSFKDNELVKETWMRRITQDYLRPALPGSMDHPFLEAGCGNFIGMNVVEMMNQKCFMGIWYNQQETKDFIRLKKDPYLRFLQGQPLFYFLDAGWMQNDYRSRSDFIGVKEDIGFKKSDGEHSLSFGDAEKYSHKVNFKKISGSGFVFDVESEDGGIFILNQMYDKRWNVFVNGKKQALFNANKYFMGLEVPPGNHKIIFKFNDIYFNICLFLSGMTFVCLLGYSVKKFYAKIIL